MMDPSLALRRAKSSSDPWNSLGGGMMGWSLTLPEGVRSSSLMGMGGGSSPLMGGVSSFSRSLGVFGDLGVLPPEWEVRGEEGGLSPLPPPLWPAEF